MSSNQIPVQVGSLSNWLGSCNLPEFFPVLHDGGTSPEYQEQLHKMEAKHFETYQSLLNELHTQSIEMKLEIVKLVLQDPREYILCLWRENELIATAQASLLFPGMRPTVHISNVVVASAHRGQGFGEFLMSYIRKYCRTTWGRTYGKLAYQLTSRAERGTLGFYERLGYKPTTTIRYER